MTDPFIADDVQNRPRSQHTTFMTDHLS